MKTPHILRRFIHSMAWIFLIYYFLPELIFGYPRAFVLLIIIAIILGFEVIRIIFGWKIYGMREYEKEQIAAYAWATMAAGIALLFFPVHLASICLIGMGIVDPIIGETREHTKIFYPYIPFLFWLLIAIIVYRFLTDYNFGMIIILSVIGSIIAIISEYPKIMVDDDFMMVVVPIIVLRMIEWIIM